MSENTDVLTIEHEQLLEPKGKLGMGSLQVILDTLVLKTGLNFTFKKVGLSIITIKTNRFYLAVR